jgi:hypothetical protein
MHLKLSDAANWAEVISAVAIVVSLIYVGVQVSDNTSATRSASASHANTEFIGWYTHISSDPEIVDIWYRGVRDPESLTDQEFLRFIFLVHIIMLQFQNNYYLVEEGTLEKKVLESITLTLTTIKGTAGFEKYWALRKQLFYPEYRTFIEELMYNSQHEPSPTYTQ